MSTPKPHICTCPGCLRLTLDLLCSRHRLVPELGRVEQAQLARALIRRRRIFTVTTTAPPPPAGCVDTTPAGQENQIEDHR